MNIITYTLRPFSLDYAGAPVPEENLVDFVVQRKITEADTLTTQLGATQFGLISDPPPSSPIFMPDALPVATLPLYPGLGQSANTVACIPSGMVRIYHHWFKNKLLKVGFLN